MLQLLLFGLVLLWLELLLVQVLDVLVCLLDFGFIFGYVFLGLRVTGGLDDSLGLLLRLCVRHREQLLLHLLLLLLYLQLMIVLHNQMLLILKLWSLTIFCTFGHFLMVLLSWSLSILRIQQIDISACFFGAIVLLSCSLVQLLRFLVAGRLLL